MAVEDDIPDLLLEGREQVGNPHKVMQLLGMEDAEDTAETVVVVEAETDPDFEVAQKLGAVRQKL